MRNRPCVPCAKPSLCRKGAALRTARRSSTGASKSEGLGMRHGRGEVEARRVWGRDTEPLGVRYGASRERTRQATWSVAAISPLFPGKIVPNLRRSAPGIRKVSGPNHLRHETGPWQTHVRKLFFGGKSQKAKREAGKGHHRRNVRIPRPNRPRRAEDSPEGRGGDCRRAPRRPSGTLPTPPYLTRKPSPTSATDTAG